MTTPEKSEIKLQEWIVRFDGQIKQSEEIIDTQEYHENLKQSSK
ncbi:hypothetical protein [Prochlorococcus sp. MIT 1223]|nr:hypothetical protein [Prochlorococcus sp. MIT 1223]